MQTETMIRRFNAVHMLSVAYIKLNEWWR